MTASHLPGSYQLAQFHAHWGTGAKDGSEHLVQGKGYACEVSKSDVPLPLAIHVFEFQLHFVHWKSTYSSIHEALQYPDGLAVIGVFLNVSLLEIQCYFHEIYCFTHLIHNLCQLSLQESEEDNPSLQPLIERLNMIQSKNVSTPLVNGFDPLTLFPSNYFSIYPSIYVLSNNN